MNQTGGPYMTREEFGLDLFDAIRACSGAQQVLHMISIDVNKGKDTTELAARYQELKAKAKKLAQSETINGEDAARLARQYPWLLA